MTATRRIHIRDDVAALQRGIDDIRRELELPDRFPARVEAAAERAATRRLPPRPDRTDLPFITIDPPGALDLDQAMCLEPHGAGYRVYYAIADVAAFVQPGDPIDVEANRRGETLYGADRKIPLHPQTLSEGAASLLPDEVRPALLWCIDLDSDGERRSVHVERAWVKSRAQLDYDAVQKRIDAGAADPIWELLRRTGQQREALERARGGISLALPEQQVRVEDGAWKLSFRPNRAVEGWNEQISLLTGMAAADLMLQAGVGLLRILPEPPRQAIERLRRSARALEIDWPEDLSYPHFIATLDGANPLHVAMMVHCTALLRGADYAAFDGDAPEHRHSALAADYAHATAPLRRLGDRYVGEICLSVCAGVEPPDWVREALPRLPETMRNSARRASRYEREVMNLAEAFVLASRVGEKFRGAITDVDRDDDRNGEVMIRDPAIEARVTARHTLPLGEPVAVRLIEVDIGRRLVRFELS